MQCRGGVPPITKNNDIIEGVGGQNRRAKNKAIRQARNEQRTKARAYIAAAHDHADHGQKIEK